MKALVTGAGGFIGHHLVDHLLKETTWDMIVALDHLASPSTLSWQRLEEAGSFENPRVRTAIFDCSEPIPTADLGRNFDFIFHLAAETHVDRSIVDARSFVISNVLGTMEMLEFARMQRHLERFLYFSTDEVFGPAPLKHPGFREWDPYHSANPYAATKAGGEELVLAYANTHKIPCVITHCMNVFGERQHAEKFIPSTIRKVRDGEVVTIHADATRTLSGSRSYIHARNVASAILFILEHFTEPSCGKFNIVGEREVSNLEMAKWIASFVGKPLKHELVDFHSSRPGHDLRYALDGGVLRRAGWEAPVDFEQSLRRTVLWYLKNQRWLKDVPEDE